jgi:hypothetical protein
MTYLVPRNIQARRGVLDGRKSLDKENEAFAISVL